MGSGRVSLNTGDVFGNASGGVRRGAIYEGRLDLGIEADLEKLFGWPGAKFHANVINSHGNGLSRDYIGNLMTVSNIEALNHTRLYELWIEKTFGQNFALRFGQFGADAEFDTSKYAGSLLNATFGWPAISGVNLPAGGPAFPLSAFGVRARAKLSDQLTVLLAMFDGNAAGPGIDDPQNLDPLGLNFRLRDSPLLMAELQYAYQLDASRPGTLKLGAWMHTGDFCDPRFDTNGVALANPASNGMPLQHRGASAPYAVFD
jgi:porin